MANGDEFREGMRADFERLLELNRTKGRDYAGLHDAFANFKTQAASTGLKPEQVWAVFAGKHWEAIMTFVRSGSLASEPIEGRIDDLILYLFLLQGMLRQLRADGHTEVPF